MISPVGPVGSVIALAVFPILYAIALAGAMLFAADRNLRLSHATSGIRAPSPSRP